MPTLQASRQVDQVYPEVRNRLIESGDWDRLQQTLTRRLSECGWLDNVRHTHKEKAKGISPLSFERLLSASHGPAPQIPPAIRKEILALIRQQVEVLFES